MKRFTMMTVVAVVAGIGMLALAPGVEAQTKAKPFQFGLGSLGAWMIGAGKPAAGDTNQYGLYLQKGTATANFSAAGASLLPLPSALTASNLTELSFQIPGYPGEAFGVANGYCGAGAPRFNVTSSSGTCFLGCQAGNETQDPATGWWTIKFSAPLSQYTGCTAPSGNITNIDIIFDEGNDVGPGNVVLDNITIKKGTQAFVIGAP